MPLPTVWGGLGCSEAAICTCSKLLGHLGAGGPYCQIELPPNADGLHQLTVVPWWEKQLCSAEGCPKRCSSSPAEKTKTDFTFFTTWPTLASSATDRSGDVLTNQGPTDSGTDALFGRKSPCTAPSNGVGSPAPTAWGQSICVSNWALFCWNSFSPSVYLLSNVYQYGLMDTYFIFWAIIQYHFIHLLAQIVPAVAFRSSFSQSLCPFDILALVWWFVVYCFVLRLSFWDWKLLLAHFVYFLPQAQNLPFLQGVLVPFSREWYVKPRPGR